MKKILKYIDIGIKEGAKLACGGKQFTENGCDKGVYLTPTLLVDCNNKMRVAQEEIFGPVAVVIKFHDVDEVIAMANDSIYGLGGAVFSKDINKALKIYKD